MGFCQFCGAKVEDTDEFCCACGKKIELEEGAIQVYDFGRKYEKEPMDKLCCELAYSGTLFWLPLVICPKHTNARYCANQGLWVLILAVLACTTIRILGAVNGLLAGKMIGIISSGIYALLFMVFLAVMFYLLWQSVKRAMAIHDEEELTSILFFDKVRIIK